MALYSGIRGSARGPNGSSPTFPIAQGTREGCVLSQLLFLIFFADAMRVQARANLEEGAIMMGPSSKIGDFDLTESDQDLDRGGSDLTESDQDLDEGIV